MDECLSDRERGGFYASQDADINLDDDGDYFTWTKDEAASAVFSPDEFAIASIYYDIGDVGDMHHNPAKNVLHRKLSLAEAASRANLPLENAEAVKDAAKQKLLRRASPANRSIH